MTGTASATALAFARRVVAEHGRTDGRHAVVELTQSELARRFDISPGTVGYYLRTLGPAVLSRRPLVIDLSRLDTHTDPSPTETPSDPLVVVLAAVAAVQAANAQLVTALAHLLARDDRSRVREEPREEFAKNLAKSSRVREQVRELWSTRESQSVSKSLKTLTH